MGAETSASSLSFVDERIAAIAARQNGEITRRQLMRCGLSTDAIKHRLRRGRLHRLHRGVYLVGHAVPPPLAAETAAVLACAPGGVLSHDTAASLWEIRPAPEGPVHITVPRRDARRPNLRVHRSPLPPDQVARRRGLPVTTPARTLLDLADILTPSQLEQATAEAERRSLIGTRDLLAFVERAHGRKGARALTAALAEGPRFTRSEAERRLLELVRKAGLPCPQTNVRLEGLEVDFLWPAHRLVVEVDGYAFHSSRTAFRRDRERNARLQAAGFTVMRFTWHDITDEPHRLVARLAAALAA